MKPYYEHAGISIILGDCREVLPTITEASVDAAITDPPYGLQFMAMDWDRAVPAADTWPAVRRVLKPGGHILTFGGTRTWHRLACAIEDAGFEIRDTLMWLYGSGFPKSLDISNALDKQAGAERDVIGLHERQDLLRGKAGFRNLTGEIVERGPIALTAPSTDAAKLWDGYGTALKPAWEPILLAMKPCEGTFAENALMYDVAGLNITRGRIPLAGIEHHSTPGSATVGSGGVYEGGYAGTPRVKDLMRYESSGRWPANLLLEEEAARMLDEQSGNLAGSGNINGTCRGLRKNTYNSIGGAMRSPFNAHDLGGGASRFFYTAKADSAERGTGNNHPTVKPLDLMRYLCGLLCPPSGGLLLDPFMGSGSTLLAGRRFFKRVIGIEIEERYCEIAAKRLSQEVFEFQNVREMETEAEGKHPGAAA